jgi:hypothetical protein
MYALSKIAYWPSGAAAVVKAGVLDLVDEILESQVISNSWMSTILGNLAIHESTAIAVVTLNPCRRILALCR